MTRPPRLATAIIARLTPGPDHDEVLGDLEERFGRIAQTHPGRAARWYWRQVIRSAPGLAWDRVVERTNARPSRREDTKRTGAPPT